MSSNTYGRQVVLPMTNKSGGSVAAGDVVIVDTGNNDAFTTTTSAGFTGGIGIATGTIANNAVGVILVSGYASLVNVNASVTRGNFGKTFTVAKQASDAGAARVAGTFCQFLTGGTTPDALIYPVDLAAAALTNPMNAVGDIIQGTTAGAPARLGAGTAGFVLTSAGAATPLVWAAAVAGFMGASAYNSAVQAINNTTETPLTLDTELYDTDAIHSTSSNTSRFTIPATGGGKWTGIASTAWDTNATGNRYMWWRLNGTRVKGGTIRENGNISRVTYQVDLLPIIVVAGDYLEVAAYQDSGGARNIGDASDTSAITSIAAWRIG